MVAFILFLGLIVYFVGVVMVAIAAFKEGALWGLGVLFVPFFVFVFVAMRWEVAKKPFGVAMGGLGLAVIAGVLGGIMGKKPDLATSPDKTAAVASSSATTPSTSAAASTPSSSSSTATSSSGELSTSFDASAIPTISYPVGEEENPSPQVVTSKDIEPEQQDQPKFEQVWVDTATHSWYSPKCKKHPDSAFSMAKSVAIKQGYVQARCR